MPHQSNKLPKCKRSCTPLCGSGGSRCKSSREHHFKDSSVADTERRLSCKQVHVGAKPTGGSNSDTLHIVTVSIPCCERGGAGANPAVGTISYFRAHGEVVEPVVRKSTLPGASPGRTSSFIGYERASELAWFGTKTSPGQHRGIRPILVCSLTVRASGS